MSSGSTRAPEHHFSGVLRNTTAGAIIAAMAPLFARTVQEESEIEFFDDRTDISIQPDAEDGTFEINAAMDGDPATARAFVTRLTTALHQAEIGFRIELVHEDGERERYANDSL